MNCTLDPRCYSIEKPLEEAYEKLLREHCHPLDIATSLCTWKCAQSRRGELRIREGSPTPPRSGAPGRCEPKRGPMLPVGYNLAGVNLHLLRLDGLFAIELDPLARRGE
jgi:hypothetical protein